MTRKESGSQTKSLTSSGDTICKNNHDRDALFKRKKIKIKIIITSQVKLAKGMEKVKRRNLELGDDGAG